MKPQSDMQNLTQRVPDQVDMYANLVCFSALFVADTKFIWWHSYFRTTLVITVDYYKEARFLDEMRTIAFLIGLLSFLQMFMGLV